MDPPRFDIGRVESSVRQRSEQRHFGGQSFDGDGSSAAVQPGVDPFGRTSGPPAR